MHHKVGFLKSALKNFYSFKRCFSNISSEKSHYAVLNISPNAQFQEIKEAYLKLAKLYHPDLHPGDDEKHKIFLQISEAYSVLSKTQAKEEYDLRMHLTTMEVQHATQNQWTVDYPLPPSSDSDPSIKEAYKIQATKMWTERTLDWQNERLHHQASRGLSLSPYSSTFYLNFRVFDRLSGQEVTVLSANFFAALVVVFLTVGYFCIMEYRHRQKLSTDPSIIWDELKSFMETQSKYDIRRDFELERLRL